MKTVNVAPHAAKFNQGIELWLGLESYLQENAAANSRRIVVFAGPVFCGTDPVYRGVDIRLKFFKVAAFLHHGELAATGYVVDQTPQLADLPEIPRPGVTDDAPPLGPFWTFQVPIRNLAALTGLDLGQLAAVDRMPIAAARPSARVTSTWREVHSPRTWTWTSTSETDALRCQPLRSCLLRVECWSLWV